MGLLLLQCNLGEKKNFFFSPSKEEGGMMLDQKVNLFNE